MKQEISGLALLPLHMYGIYLPLLRNMAFSCFNQSSLFCISTTRLHTCSTLYSWISPTFGILWLRIRHCFAKRSEKGSDCASQNQLKTNFELFQQRFVEIKLLIEITAKNLVSRTYNLNRKEIHHPMFVNYKIYRIRIAKFSENEVLIHDQFVYLFNLTHVLYSTVLLVNYCTRQAFTAKKQTLWLKKTVFSLFIIRL